MSQPSIRPLALLGGALSLLAACSGPALVAPTPTATAPGPRFMPPIAAASATPSSAPATPAVAAEGEALKEVFPCLPGTPEYSAASADLKALGALIEALPVTGDPTAAKQALATILTTRCFEMARYEVSGFDGIDSAASLKKFWSTGGGGWLSSTLDLGAPEKVFSVVPPSFRKTLAPETRPGHPLTYLLCSLGDASCGQETQGWASRAQEDFNQRAEIKLSRALLAPVTPHGPTRPQSEASCAAQALDPAAEIAPQMRYSQWRACVEDIPSRGAALPLGRTRAPREGWFILRGRRGHHSFCDEVRAYDLATGAAYVSQSCSGLALTQLGQVDQGQTDAKRAAKVATGRLFVDNLREAVWMTLFADEVEPEIRVHQERFPVPKGVRVMRGTGSVSHSSTSSFFGSSDQTRLAWSYVVAGKPIQSGELTYPHDNNDVGKDYALDLLKIAEASFEVGCAPAPLPGRIEAGTKKPGVSRRDATPEGIRTTEEDLMKALEGLRRQPPCPAGAGAHRKR